MEKSTRIAVLASPGFSHLFPILEFSKRLVHLHPDFHVTCVVPAFGSHSSSSIAYLQTLPSNIDSILLPPIPKEKVPQDTVLATQIEGTVTLSLPDIRQELKSMKSKTGLAALVADIFALDTVFLFTAGIEPIKIPGCLLIHGRHLPMAFQDRSSLGYKMFLERSRKFCLADGVLFNSFEELEPDTIRALREEIGKKRPQVHAVGPIIQSGLNSSNETTDSGSDCLTWLNNQPPKSVLYVSFGSGGTLSQDQLNELAYGLELSKIRFLWVLRSPSKVSSAAYLDTINENPLDFLPEGFLERTKERGLVVPSWAPQIPILKHSSVGGFLSHCGWNSTLESIIHGVPFITWPLFAEQRMNAVLLTHGLKVAVWPTADYDDGMVKKEEIAEAIRRLMEGEESDEIRARINVLKVKAVEALKKDGPSTMALSVFAESLRN